MMKYQFILKDAQIELMLQDIDMIEKRLNFDAKSVTFFGSARFNQDNEFCKNAYLLSKKLAKNGFIIVTGGGDGIMAAANQGASEIKNAKSIGINAILPNEQKVNKYVNDGMVFSTMALRKVALMKNSSAFVIFPGGYGTLDELFEVLVLVQSFKMEAKIFLFGVKFWSPLVEFFKSSLVENKAIKESEMDIFTISDDIDFIYKQIAEI